MIRDAAPGDAPAVANIWNHYIRDTLVTFNFAEKSETDVAADITARQAQGMQPSEVFTGQRVWLGFVS